MKQSLNTHDIYVLSNELVFLQGLRVSNIYDIDSKTICIKFNNTCGNKIYLAIESGTKFYLLNNNFTALRDSPTSFCSKLRKHLNNKRLETIRQINLDRVIELKFGSDEYVHYLIGEFYASGNIILTSLDYKILTLIHPHTYDTTCPNQDSNENTNGMSNEETNNSVNKFVNKFRVCVGSTYSYEYSTSKLELDPIVLKSMFNDNLVKIDKKIKLKQFISKLPLIKFSLNVIEHAFTIVKINIKQKISSETKFDDIFTDLAQSTQFVDEIKKLFELDFGKNTLNGCITKSNTDIYPYIYAHLDVNELIVDKNFTEISGNYFQALKPIETKDMKKQKETTVKLSKQEKIIWNIEQQIKTMEQNIDLIKNQINLLTTHNEHLSSILDLYVVEGMLRDYSGFDNEFLKIIEFVEYKKVIKFELEGVLFELNYMETIFVGIENLYKKIKKIKSKLLNAYDLLEKQNKTLSKLNFKPKLSEVSNISETTNTNTNRIIQSELNNTYIVPGQSKPNWFEQFNWFYTSNGLLFISGKTAEQNEQIVKRYMNECDIYIHSDTFGSGSGVIKNPLKLDIPESSPSSLIECGNFLIAHTKAWENGTSNSAYWVKPSQVSKTPESGEYISKGSFIIRGQKNIIRVDNMELGFGIVFKIVGKEGFVGKVGINDKIEYGIPILATYSATTDYKFKVKVIPGTQKIKKALQDVMSSFMKKTNLSEKEAIKKISNDSIQKVLINKIRFVMIK